MFLLQLPIRSYLVHRSLMSLDRVGGRKHARST